MENRDRDSLKELFERFMPAAEAEAAAEDVRTGDAILRAHPAPEPDGKVVLGIKLEIAAHGSGRRRIAYRLCRFAATAAAVIALALLAIHSQIPQTDPNLSHAALIPTFIWESDDISADDMDLAYFTSEIRQIEAQVNALETGEDQDIGTGTLDEVEMELMRINTGFWKE